MLPKTAVILVVCIRYHRKNMQTSLLAVLLSVSAAHAFVPAPSASLSLRASPTQQGAVGGQRHLTIALASATGNMMAAHRAQLKSPGGWVLAGCGMCVGFGYLASSLQTRSRNRAFGCAGTGSDFPDIVETRPPHPEWKPPQKQPPPEGSEKGEGLVAVFGAL